MHKNWNLLSSHEAFRDNLLKVQHDRYRLIPSGTEQDFTVLNFADWVNIIPLTADGQVIMIRQYRHGNRQTSIEIPGGVIDPGESPMAAARRELLEETGYSSNELIELGSVAPNPALQNNRCHTFLAKGVWREAEQSLDPMEEIQITPYPLEQVLQMVGNGQIDHALVVAAFSLYMLYDQRSR